MEISQLKTEYQTKNSLVQQRKGSRDTIVNLVQKLESEVTQLNADVISYEKAVWVLQQYADIQQQLVTSKVEEIVTLGLRRVFQDPTLTFRLHYSETKSGTKKKNPEITMSVSHMHNGESVVGDIRNSFGGGLSVVISVLLRVVITSLFSGRVRPILFLDEPLKDLSPSYDSANKIADGYRDRMAEFLRELTDETDMQIIMVSHESSYRDIADVDYRLEGGIGMEPTVTKYTREEDF